MAIKNYFPTVPDANPNDPMSLLPSPYYSYSGQNNLFTPRGYAQNTLVDLLSTRGALGEAVADEEVTTEATEATEPAFQEVKDSGEQSFFNGMDINEGDSLDYDSLSNLSLTDGLFGGKTVSGNAPTGWNTQHQREFDAFVAAGLKPKAKWNGNDWYVYANELDGTPFGEQGTMSFSDTVSSGGKYKGQGFPNLFAGMTGSFNADEVFKKNLANVLTDNPGAATGGIQGDPSTILGSFDSTTKPTIETPSLKDQSLAKLVLKSTTSNDVKNNPVLAAQVEEANKILGVTAKRGGTVTAKRPDEKPKPKSVSLKQVIEKAVNTLVPQKEDRSDEIKANRTSVKAVEQAREASKNLSGNQRRGYGF